MQVQLLRVSSLSTDQLAELARNDHAFKNIRKCCASANLNSGRFMFFADEHYRNGKITTSTALWGRSTRTLGRCLF
jgi:hypothetical protein